MGRENVTHIHNGILVSHKKNEMLSLTPLCMELKIIKLSKLYQAKKKTSADKSTHIWNEKVIPIEVLSRISVISWKNRREGKKDEWEIFNQLIFYYS